MSNTINILSQPMTINTSSSSAMTTEMKSSICLNPRLIILYETDLTQDEIATIYSVCKATIQFDATMLKSTIGDILQMFGVLLVDVRKPEYLDWYINCTSYVTSNYEKCKVIYKRKHGDKLKEKDTADLKKNLKACAVKKYLPESCKDWNDLVIQMMSDHVSSAIVQVSKCERIMNAIDKLFL